MEDILAVRGRLQRLGLVLEEGNTCHVCRVGKKKICHLFVHCGRTYKLWARVAKMWSLNFVRARDVGTNFDIWCHVIPKDLRAPFWRMTFVALT